MDAAMSGRAGLETVEEIETSLLLEAVYRRYHYDFRSYAPTTMIRRLAQARVHFSVPTLSALQEKVLHDPAAFQQLLGFLTIQVSEMFRDPGYFRVLREEVVPHLRTYPSLKVWVAGCADGEELHSLAILLREEGLEARTIFYATDVNPVALKRAEVGIYELDRIPLFTENHRQSGGRCSLSEYYTAAYGGAAFDKTLRQRTVFSAHSLVSDAVFAEVHLVSCRNVLIYFDRDLQDRAVGLFRDSLVHGGFLGLGAKETVRFLRHADSFRDFSQAERIYRKTSAEFRAKETVHAAA
jgi:chemotaxis protein methyltransferase CheR